MDKHRSSLIVVGLLVLALSLALAACGDDGSDGGPSTSAGGSTTSGPPVTVEGPEVMTIQEALSAEGLVRVVGAIVATYPEGATPEKPGEPTIVFTTALAESYPPQPGGPSIPVKGLDLEELVGLSTSLGQPDASPATWSNYWMVLEGRITDGTLEVTATPAVITAITPELRLRFSVVSYPMVSGNSEWWAFDLRNRSEKAVDLTFPNGQEAEVILSQDGVEKYRWSGDKLFTEAIKEVRLEPGQVYAVAINDSLNVPPGRYDLQAFITAKATVDGVEVLLPPLEGSVDVL